MPKRAARVCAAVGCAELVTNGRYCDTHVTQQRRSTPRPSSAAQGYDAQWKRIRAAFLAEHPLCDECRQPATEVHHIIALKDGGTHDQSNLRALCKPHHSRKTATENGGFGNRKVIAHVV